jgi:hypothetical protein
LDSGLRCARVAHANIRCGGVTCRPAFNPVTRSGPAWGVPPPRPDLLSYLHHHAVDGEGPSFIDCLRKSVLPSLAYGGHSCSLKWKVDPQWRYTQRHFGWDSRRQTWPHGPFVTKLIGYDAGPRDSRRLAKASGKWPPGHAYRYPLVEWGSTREACEQVILREGLPLPVKSACWMCPASKRDEVNRLAATHPDLAQAAIEMERRAHARGLTTTQGLGRRWSWSEHLGFGAPRSHSAIPLPLQ